MKNRTDQEELIQVGYKKLFFVSWKTKEDTKPEMVAIFPISTMPQCFFEENRVKNNLDLLVPKRSAS
jgi:hypothetical protein